MIKTILNKLFGFDHGQKTVKYTCLCGKKFKINLWDGHSTKTMCSCGMNIIIN